MIVCVGSIALDTTKTPMGNYSEEPGGSGVYFSLAASLLSKAALVSCIGSDFPKDFLDMLSKRVVISNVKIVHGGKTMRYHSTFSKDFSTRRGDLTEMNVFDTFEPELSAEQAKSHFAYLGTLNPPIQLSIIEQLEKPKFIAMDTIEYFIANDRSGVLKVLSEVDCAILNDAEAKLICGKDNLISCGKTILDNGPSMCIIKKGEHGCILFHNDGSVHPYPAFPLENVIDPTGAGDAFAGGFMGYLSRESNTKKDSVRKAVAWGTVTGSITVEGFGTKPLQDADFELALGRYNAYHEIMHYENGQEEGQ